MNKVGNKKRKIRVVIIATIAALILVRLPFQWLTSDEVTATVTRLERETKNDGDHITSKYIVTTKEEVFENTDSWAFLKFNSSDVQGKLTEGKKYRFKVCGWRIPFFSAYRNIIKIEAEEEGK